MGNQTFQTHYIRLVKLPVLYFFLIAILWLVSCSHISPAEQYGFLTKLGNDTISVESVTRQGNIVISDEVDRFPAVRIRHTEIELDQNGGIRHLTMDIYSPGETAKRRNCKVVADVTADSVRLSKKDGTGTLRRDFRRVSSIIVAHVPQMYSLYELCFAAAKKKNAASKSGVNSPVPMRQFYIDREFDRFPLGQVMVQPLAGGRAEIMHDWLAGTGEAIVDSSYHMLSYSGARTTYKVEVNRLALPPDVKSIAVRFKDRETNTGVIKGLSVRDTALGQIGNTRFSIDYGRPLLRGRKLLGDVIAYGHVWRTGANAATQFTTSAAIKIAGIQVPAGSYSLWTLPQTDGVKLIVNKQTKQWGTEYDSSQNLGTAKMTAEVLSMPVEEFTISIVPVDKGHGTLIMKWGNFRWSVPVEAK